MPTYVYESIPSSSKEAVLVFEIDQRMSEAPLSVHPITGLKIRRIITADRGIIGSAAPECGSDCGIPGSGSGACQGCCHGQPR